MAATFPPEILYDFRISELPPFFLDAQSQTPLASQQKGWPLQDFLPSLFQ